MITLIKEPGKKSQFTHIHIAVFTYILKLQPSFLSFFVKGLLTGSIMSDIYAELRNQPAEGAAYPIFLLTGPEFYCNFEDPAYPEE